MGFALTAAAANGRHSTAMLMPGGAMIILSAIRGFLGIMVQMPLIAVMPLIHVDSKFYHVLTVSINPLLPMGIREFVPMGIARIVTLANDRRATDVLAR